MDASAVSSQMLSAPPRLATNDGSCRVWLTAEPWGIASVVDGRFTAECVGLLNQAYELALPSRPPGVRMHILHDWRRAVAYESQARTLMVEAAKVQRDVLGTVHILLGNAVPPLVMMGIELALLAVRPIGTDIRVLRTAEELRAELPRLRVTPLHERAPMAAAR